MNMIQIYEFSKSHHNIFCQYGYVTIQEWLKKEKERIERTEGRVANIVTDANGEIALEVNDVSERKE